MDLRSHSASLARAAMAVMLSLVLLLTAVSAGMARGQATPVGTIELCRGLTVVTVAVDAQGAPVHHVHLCPDGVMTLVGEVPFEALLSAPVPLWQALSGPAVTQHVAGQRPLTVQARGPPLPL